MKENNHEDCETYKKYHDEKLKCWGVRSEYEPAEAARLTKEMCTKCPMYKENMEKQETI